MKYCFSLLFFSLFLSCSTHKGLPFDPFAYSIEKNIVASNGAVVSAHPLASAVGVSILKKGGNAMDAVIAVQLALAVVYPNAGNLGGGGFLVGRLADSSLISIDFRETAPRAATRDMYLDEKGNPVEGKSLNGHLSAGVPGTVAGLFESHQYAQLPFSTLIEPAIVLAEKGFAITKREALSLNSIADDLKKYNSVSSAFLKDVPWKEGDILVQKDLAATLKRIKDKGADGFYKGKTADLILREMERGGGLISKEDLQKYKAVRRQPHSFDYRGYQVVSMPLPSSGGIMIHQMLKMVEPHSLGDYGFHAPEAVQLMVEVERRAFADRSAHMGDPDFQKLPIQQITSEPYLKERMKDFRKGSAMKSSDLKAGLVFQPESEETTHISVIDKQGNAVAVTTTLNNSYGSKTVVGGAGFFPNDEMDDFSVKPGAPNLYGAIGGEANSIAPGKRMLSSMTPTLVLQNNAPFLVIGTPGGTTIPTSVFQTIVNIIDFELPLKDAVNAPKFHHQWWPDEVMVETDFPFATRQALEEMGYLLKERAPIGRTEVILVLPDGRFEAVADKRGDDAAAGY